MSDDSLYKGKHHVIQCPHILAEVVAKPGDLFSGVKQRCTLCGLFEQEIALGLGDDAYLLVEKQNRLIASGPLDRCFAEARKLGYRNPARFTRMTRIEENGTEIHAFIRKAHTSAAHPGGSVNHAPDMPSAPRTPRLLQFPKRGSSESPVVPDDYARSTQ